MNNIEQLETTLVNTMLDHLENGVPHTDQDGETKRSAPSASLMNVVRQYLRDTKEKDTNPYENFEPDKKGVLKKYADSKTLPFETRVQ